MTWWFVSLIESWAPWRLLLLKLPPSSRGLGVACDEGNASQPGSQQGSRPWLKGQPGRVVAEALPILNRARPSKDRFPFPDYGICTNLHRDTDKAELSIRDSLIARRRTTESWLGRGGGGDAHLEDMKVRALRGLRSVMSSVSPGIRWQPLRETYTKLYRDVADPEVVRSINQ